MATGRTSNFETFRGFMLSLTTWVLFGQRRGKGTRAVEQPEGCAEKVPEEEGVECYDWG